MTETGAAIAETHISVLFFVADRAYKLKKPVAFSFLDFSTRDARERACHREVELNRRLAPDVYLGVGDVHGPDGELCDHFVVMARMPTERRLSKLVVDHAADVPDHLRQVATTIAAFHQSAERGPLINAAASRDAIAGEWQANFDEMQRFVGRVFDERDFERARSLSASFLSRHEALFQQRIEAGHVCDGHGDLQAADIFCLDDGPRILDCIEFDDHLRYGDVIDDVAFLAMDLERLGAPAQAERFLALYETAIGASLPRHRLHLAIAYRAQVRAKVAALRWSQEDPAGAEAQTALAQARDLLGLCVDHLEQSRVRLVLIGGLPGAGKTTLARGVGERTGAVVLRSDQIRKALSETQSGPRRPAEFEAGTYDPEMTRRVYGDMIEQGRLLLEQGTSVVLDASWIDETNREAARALAREVGAELEEVRCVVDAATAAQRIERRLQRGRDASEATPAVASAMADRAHSWPEAIDVTTDGPAHDVLETYLATRANR